MVAARAFARNRILDGTGGRAAQSLGREARDDKGMADDRERLRTTFERAANLYHEARPEYPAQFFDTLVEMAGLRAGDQLLEIGCATGKATISLAERGFRITCVELGRDLASTARRNLAAFRDVVIVECAFETWQPSAGIRFDLVFAATAWHWIDPATRYQRAWDALRPGGHLAFWSAAHVLPDDGDPFFSEIQEVYEEIGEGLPEGVTWPRPGEPPDSRDEIESSGLFEDIVVRHFDWEISYTAEEYLRLLDTFSGHIAMEAWKRDRLYGEIRRRLGQRYDGRLRRHWGAVLNVARRVDSHSVP